MGARGPAPQPTKLKLLRGNPGRRPLNTREPKPAPIVPRCPSWLDKEARREWRRIVPVLDKIGLLTQADMSTLAGYCQSYSRWQEAEADVTRRGVIITESRMNYDVTKPNPAIVVAQKERQLMMQFGARLGLSPSDRGRMTLPEVEDDGDDLLD